MSRELDPEDLRDLLRMYQMRIGEVIRELDGYVAQYLGDGVLAYFGYPTAHEDDARRAVLAGLRMVSAISERPASLATKASRAFQVRVGVHTGSVVVGEMGTPDRRELLAVGETPNVAARVQATAEPNTVVVSEATYRLTERAFDYKSLGGASLRGFEGQITLYQALSFLGDSGRVIASRGQPELVDRLEELAFLQSAWQETVRGTGRVITLSGEPGIGKSRLIGALVDGVLSEPHWMFECRCSPLFSNTALHPWIEMLERRLSFSPRTSQAARLRRLQRALAYLGLSQERALPLLAPLLAIELPASSDGAPFPSSAMRERQALLDCLVSVLDALATKRPLLLVIEDLQWADPSTVELLRCMSERSESHAMLVVVSHRPDFRFPWKSTRISERVIPRMGDTDAASIVAAVVRRHTMSHQVLQEVLGRADGVPLYLEEITKAVLESQGRNAQRGTAETLIPESLQASLTARLDHLGSSKQLLQLGAVIGRRFNFGLLRALAEQDDSQLRAELDRLVGAELLFRGGEPPDETYTFKHALIQDAAYDSMLRVTRQAHHAQLASTLTQAYPELAAAQPELLARHYAGAAMPTQATAHWTQAAVKAVTRFAYAEATHALGSALEQLQQLPASEARDRQEIELRIFHGTVQSSVKGYAAAEVADAYGRAYALCERYQDIPPNALLGLMSVNIVRSDRRNTRQLATRLEQMRTEDRDCLIGSKTLLGIEAFFLGQYTRALEQLGTAAALNDYENLDALLQSLRTSQTTDPYFNPMVYSAWCHIIQGQPEQAFALWRKVHALAEGTGHAYSLALTLDFGAQLLLDLGEDQAQVEAMTAREYALSAENGFPFWLATAQIRLGLLDAKRGEHQVGIERLEGAIAMLRAIGGLVVCPAGEAALVETYLIADRVELALARVSEALASCDDALAEAWRPRFLWLWGRALSQRGDLGVAAERLRDAVSGFQAQGARWLVLRAGTELAQLSLAAGRPEEARAVLAPLAGSFDERWQYAPLQAARALLVTLGA